MSIARLATHLKILSPIYTPEMIMTQFDACCKLFFFKKNPLLCGVITELLPIETEHPQTQTSLIFTTLDLGCVSQKQL